MAQIAEIRSEEIDIRPANESDAGALAKLIAEPGFDYPTEFALVSCRLTDLMLAGDLILVTVYRSELVGMILLHRTRFLHRRPDGRISALVVAESVRGHGIGTRLVKEAESVFRQWGCGRIEVTSGAQREAAHRFYIRAGYTEKPKRFIKLLTDS